MVAASLVDVTKRLKFLVALRPGHHPAGAVRAHGGDARPAVRRPRAGQPGDGRRPDRTGRRRPVPDHEERYEVSDEFVRSGARCSTRSRMTARRSLRRQAPEGQRARKVLYPPSPGRIRRCSSAARRRPGARPRGAHIDTYLTWGEPPAVAKRSSPISVAAQPKLGRKIKFGIRLHVIVRETEEEAWAAADKLISKLDDDIIQRAQASSQRWIRIGQRRMAGIARRQVRQARQARGVRPTCGPAWASCAAVRARRWWVIRSRSRAHPGVRGAGYRHFILSGYPHLEESYRFAELVFPLLPLATREKLHVGSVVGAVRRNRRQRHICRSASQS
jgi:alkanesulfonate monooxygenase